MGLSLRETATILEVLDVHRSHQAIWQWEVNATKRVDATLTEVSRTRSEVTTRCIEGAENGEGWYSHAWSPAFYAGTQTFAFEIAAQRAWTVPDAVIMSLGHGALFLGAYPGFRALRNAGWIDRLPKLLGAQVAGFVPIANEFHEPLAETNMIADGIQIQQPARREEILEAISVTEGDAISLTEDAVQVELKRLHRAGFYTEPTSAIAPAALKFIVIGVFLQIIYILHLNDSKLKI